MSDTITVSVEVARRLTAISAAAGDGRTNPRLAVAWLAVDDSELTVTATDSHILARRSLTVGDDVADVVPVAVDAKRFADAVKDVAKSSLSVTFEFGDDGLVVSGEAARITLQFEDVTMPDVGKIFDGLSDSRTYDGLLPVFNPTLFAKLVKSAGYTAAKQPPVALYPSVGGSELRPFGLRMASSDSYWTGVIMPVRV